jgi:hypothetical protein
MGKVATCAVTFGGRRATVKAHLDSAKLELRGELRADFPFDAMRDVRTRGGKLAFRTPEGAVELELGAVASAWAEAILHPKSLLDKLGVKPGLKVFISRIADPTFLADLEARLGQRPATACRGSYDLIFAGFESSRDLESIAKLRDHLEPNGAVWLVAPKGKNSPLPESELRAAMLAATLIDVKVASFSTTHTAVKAVIPVAQRAAAR